MLSTSGFVVDDVTFEHDDRNGLRVKASSQSSEENIKLTNLEKITFTTKIHTHTSRLWHFQLFETFQKVNE